MTGKLAWNSKYIFTGVPNQTLGPEPGTEESESDLHLD